MIDTSMYRIVRGEELLRSKGKEPPSTWQITDAQGNLTERKRSIGTHPHGISVGHKLAPHKQMSADKWVQIASATDSGRPCLTRIWQQGEYSVSADGHRAHRVKMQASNALAWEYNMRYEGGPVPDFNALYPRNPQYRFTVSTEALWRALHAVKPFARDASDIVRFSGDAYTLWVEATSAEYGDAKVTIEGSDYSASNAPDMFALASRYALDALRGMGERVTIATCGQYGNKPFVFTSGEREALVMPMHISR